MKVTDMQLPNWAGDPAYAPRHGLCTCGSTAGCPSCMPGNYRHDSDYGFYRFTPNPEAWECPVCHKGNAPHVSVCGHCANQPIPTTTNTDTA